jgi:hypothetical protein
MASGALASGLAGPVDTYQSCRQPDLDGCRLPTLRQRPILDRLQQLGFRVSAKLREHILSLAGEA